MRRGDDTSDGAQALTEALSSLLFSGTAPQHPRQLVSRVVLLGSYREIGEQGLRLPGGKRQASLAIAGLKSPEKPKRETRHCAFPEMSDRSLPRFARNPLKQTEEIYQEAQCESRGSSKFFTRL